MDELLSIVVLIAYFAIFGAASKKKKKKGAKRQQTMKTREVNFDQAFEQMIRPRTAESRAAQAPASAATQTELRQAPRSEFQPKAIRPEREEPESRLVREQPVMRPGSMMQERMRSAAEEEDPCHDGYRAVDSGAAAAVLASMDDAYADRSPIFDPQDQDAFARDVLRGVIMSEVLARPSQRRMPGVKRGT